MDILVNVANQKLKIATNLKGLVAGTQEFVRFVFNTSGDWDGLATFAQFMQNGVAYNQYLDDSKAAYLPAEIGVGTCTVMLYGSNGNTIATTNYLTLTIDENILVSDARSTNISTSLYNQLVSKVNSLSTWNEQNAADLIQVDKDLQQQINKKAEATDLTSEISRAKTAEKANADAIALKANQSDVDDLTVKVTQLENNEVVADLISQAVTSEMNTYLSSGKLANMTITNGSISRSKVDSDFEASLKKADTAMQPSVYDPQNLKIDIFSYAQGKADTVQKNLDAVKAELQDGYKLTDTVQYTKIGDAIRGAITLSRTYAQALLADYKAFTIKIVDELPITGDSMTFYLVPNKSQTGYDKYWWITDDNGDSKWDIFGSATTLVVTELPETGDEDTDYILKSSGGCLYYKYIDGVWEVVAGSLAYVSATLPDVDSGNEFTDYYVVSEDSGSYLHYRFINGAYRVIGGDGYTKDQINAMISTLTEDVDKNAQAISTNETNISSLSKTIDKVSQDLNNLDVEGYTYYHNIVKDEDTGNYSLILYQVKGGEETIASQTILPATGGGGGSSSTTNLVVERITGSPLIVTTTDVPEIKINFSSTDSDGESVDATYAWKLGNNVIMSGALVQGENSFDMTDYVTIGTQKFTLTVTDEGGSIVVKTWTVQVVDVRLESAFSDRYTYEVGKAVNFTYTPYGSVPKTVHFILDGVELESVVTSASGTLQSYTLPTQTHGAHLLECYITATINNMQVETEHIFRDIIWYDESSDVPIIGCIYRYDHYGKYTARQYNTTSIPYVVFDPKTATPTVSLSIDGVLNSTLTLSNPYNTWAYKEDDIAEHTLEIKCRDTVVTIKMDIVELGIDVSPITANLEFDFNPTGFSNSGANRLWSDSNNTDISMSVSDNFDWQNGGYQIDSDGNQYFCVKAGTSAVINYNLFATDPKKSGAEFKIIFKTTNVRKSTATFLSCVPESDTTKVGIEMNVHEAYIYSSADNLYFPYSEEDIIEFEYNINTLDTENSSATAILMAYEDGVGGRPMLYDDTHRLYQYAPVPITIGSDDCDVHIYRMKAYSSALTDSNILSNFIADARDSDDMIARYDRNQIYNENNALTPDSVAAACPDLRVIKIEAPHFTNDKKDYVKNTSMECIYKNGDSVLDNWKFTNCYHAGQGTTSNEYGFAARNIDVICCFDGIHQVNSKITLDPDYKTELVLGDGTKYTDGTGKISLTRNSVPNNWFNFKVNVASSEMSNNALLQKRYNDYLPYSTPATRRDPKVKNSMEFVNCVIFLKESDPDVSTHREFEDTDWHFYSLGNIGDSKKTDVTRAYDPDDMKEFTIEVSDNTLPNSTFQTGVTDSDGNMVYPIEKSQWVAGNEKYDSLYNEWDESFEFRYDCCGDSKDGTATSTDAIKEEIRLNNRQIWRDFYEFVITSTDDEFKNNLGNWFIVDSALYWYLFTTRYTMIDNRAKNSFWHWAKHYISQTDADSLGDAAAYYTIDDEAAAINDGYRFDLWDYDNDTALGINNSGELTMSYGKEDTDYKTDGVPSSGYIFNAAESVFWCRIRDLMGSQLRTLYQSVSQNCWSAEHLINEFDAWQEQFPEELWRLHYERLYIRTYQAGTIRFLNEMMNGRKRYQRRQWERDQHAYMGTKYLHTDVKSDQIMFRCNTPKDAVVSPDYTLKIVPYSDMYISVLYGNSPDPVQIRAKAGTEYEIKTSLTNMDDTAILIYCASRIQALNDLSACYIHDNDFSKASKLRTLIIGNDTDGYENTFLTTLNMGNNTLLETLNVKNCPNLTGSINLSSCENLANFYADGTIVTSVLFANHGKIAHVTLPATVNSLTFRNLKDLTDLNVASYENLETFVCESSVVDALSILQAAVNTLRTVTITDINWVLSDTTLLNKVLKMSSSTLSGAIYISGQIRNQELLDYANAWNDLVVTYDSSQLVTQYLATYVNTNGDVLYTVYVDRGSVPPDPIEDGSITTPTIESTDQYDFTFSGWDDVTSEMLTPRTITAVYSTTTRKYTVTWYSRAGLSLGSKEAEYGSEVVYEGDIPTNTTEESTYIYNVFAGWDKSTGYIKGDIDVYAIWERAELPSVGKDLKDMSVAEIYAVATSGRVENYFEMKDYTDIVLGRDFDFSNVESEVLAEDLYLDGTTFKDTSIQLFGENEKTFTIAIDFQYTGTDNDGTLLSCFDENGSEGFRLRYNSHPNIQWGDKNVNVGYQKYRDIVVLRHIKGEDKLYIYSSNETTKGTTYSDTIMIVESTRSRSTSTDNKLTFGAVSFSDGGHDYYGKGMIHWCKIWYDDLGDANARELASMYHDTLRMEYCGAGRYRLAGNTSQKSNASFIANNLFGNRNHQMNATADNTGGWDSSLMRTFCNTRVFDALPTAWQSMIKSVKVSASAGNKSTEVLISEDKIYLESIVALTNSTSSIYPTEGTFIPWFTTNIYRVKFRYIIPDGASYYTNESEPSTVSTNNVKVGDVWRNPSNDNICYICVSQQDIDRYAPTVYMNCSSGIGGWVSADYWWLRSPYVDYSTTFWFVNYYGFGNTPTASYASGVCPCFSI